MTNDRSVVYKHTQTGYVNIVVLSLATAYLAYLLMQMEGEGWNFYLIAALTLSIVLLLILFSTLTVKVTDKELLFHFSLGFWKRRFSLADVYTVKVVENHLLYGWGIRYTPHGWLYNVSGLRAVELEIFGAGRIRIGTNQPEELKQAIERARQATRGHRASRFH